MEMIKFSLIFKDLNEEFCVKRIAYNICLIRKLQKRVIVLISWFLISLIYLP